MVRLGGKHHAALTRLQDVAVPGSPQPGQHRIQHCPEQADGGVNDDELPPVRDRHRHDVASGDAAARHIAHKATCRLQHLCAGQGRLLVDHA
jgi:hypothetical protein